MESFEHFRRADTVLLTTRRKDGRTVDTPINLVVDAEGRGYFRTDASSGKAKRLANFPGVRLAPCNRRGRPQGSDQPAIATRLHGTEASVAAELLAARFPIIQGRLLPLADRLRRHEVAYYRLIPADEPTPWTG
jgi:PPOX class probable F420-dependent enzyme